MSSISTIDFQTRLDVQELLGRFAHYLDHGEAARWAGLFCLNGVFECGGSEGCDALRLEGSEALATLPAMIAERGGGEWRHIITAITIDRCAVRKDLIADAYGPVIDMGAGGAIAAFYDFRFQLHRAGGWRIRHVLAKRIGAAAGCLPHVAGVTPAATERYSLQ
ncbi:nuclear transport factor 2 family protein [Sphingomonas baiyangensis]|nr:nuclear transport factor 2 family protein [Sphingomonas baiyangensis]